MEDSSIDSSFDAPTDSKLPIGLAIAGIILGGLAFIFAYSTKNRADRLNEKLETEISAVYARVDQSIADMKIAGGNSQGVETLRADVEAFKMKTQDELQRMSRAYQALAAAVESTGGRNTARQTPTSQQPQKPAPAPSGNSVPASAGEYTIKSGDMLGKIAREYGCKVSDLQLLNPELNPNKLRPGQKIKVPAKR